MIAGTLCQRVLETFWNGEDPKREKNKLKCTSLGGRETDEVRHLKPGGIRD